MSEDELKALAKKSNKEVNEAIRDIEKHNRIFNKKIKKIFSIL